MSAENERFVRVTWEELWRTGNERLIEEYRAPNYVLRNPPTGLTPDCEGLKGVVLAMRRAFPDLRVTTEEVIADGEKVAQHYRFQGTHQGALFGIPPTGKSVNVRQVIVSRVAQRKIVEEWVEINLLGLLQQVGALPALG